MNTVHGAETDKTSKRWKGCPDRWPFQLRDGTMVTLRPIRPDDAPRLQTLFARLSPRSIFLRFLGHRKELPLKLAERLANVDYQTRMALVATREPYQDDIVAVARYDGSPPVEPGLADVAIVVEDQYQGQGLGTLMLDRLVAHARAHGIRGFLATIYHDNTPIKRIIQHSGLPVEGRAESGVWEVQMKLDIQPDHSWQGKSIKKF